MSQIETREFQIKDAEKLEKIIVETWHYNQLCSPITAGRLAEVYLNSCLTNQTYTRTALVDDIPVGIIMGKNRNIHKCPLKYRIRQLASIIRLYLNKEGRQISKIFECVTEIDKELLAESSREYAGEVSFFAVDSKYRGQGIGKKLFRELLKYMEEENIKTFYLFTDTSCNFQFYEHQGMVRRCERNHVFSIKERKSNMTFYLYEYNNNKQI